MTDRQTKDNEGQEAAFPVSTKITVEAGMKDEFKRIKYRCPSCNGQTLFIDSTGGLTCSVIGCKNPLALNDLITHSLNLEEENKALREALEGIIEIGKRDMSNPGYDAYFEEAKHALGRGKERIG